MTTKRAGSPYDLCNFQFDDGRGCCMPSVPSLNGYCRSHGTVLKPRPADETNADLLLEIGLFNTSPSSSSPPKAASKPARTPITSPTPSSKPSTSPTTPNTAS